ncbi:transglutaminase family protein [Kiritimatiellota bacterium B12222]|nr:transglutaminase family protein [Kiritimatiellota bacterium B12222]
MSIHVCIKHQTTYHYERAIALSPHVIRLRPAPHSRTPILAYSLKIEPADHFINWQQDPFGNYLARLVFPKPVRTFDVSVEVIADMTVINPFDFFLEEFAEEVPFKYPEHTHQDLMPYLTMGRDKEGEAFAAFIESLPEQVEGMRTIDWLVQMNQKVNQAVGYTIRMEHGVQSCEETLTKGTGSCRDSAWLLVKSLRSCGYAARFVSGYLVQLTADEKSLDGPSGPEADFTDLHAWTEVYLPGAGWVGLDPTSGLFAGEGHIPLACSPDPQSAAPIEGAAEPCKVDFSFVNTVSRLHEDPRVTKPYTESDWEQICAIGEKVDEQLHADDVRLTMGGEPTFVSIDDMEGEEWNVTADSEQKRKLAYQLLERLEDRFGKGGIRHLGEGKWYPGEPLPRWAYGVFWRKDGEPIWRDPQWFSKPKQDDGFDQSDAKKLALKIATGLGVFPEHVLTAYEDVAYYLWKEATLPVNLDPSDPRLQSDQERKHLAKLLDGGLGKPAGYTLPLQWHPVHKRWVSSLWEFKREHLFLTPGNSPIGLRLPLESIPWTTEEEKHPITEVSPMEAQPSLPVAQPARFSSEKPLKTKEVCHTAICVEAREGQVYIFLPPLSEVEEFLDLMRVIEDSVAALKMPIILEGYPPPYDPRLDVIKVTPDPGVIEVNVHPSEYWSELVEKTVGLYEDARQSRLGAEKFLVDGRHTGTGGGNHITLGGKTPADSPFLRRPDLLRSLITYWQHHPGLSYLFSGLFIGPSSQAPRADEGRDDRLHEMEIAFSQLPKGDEPPPPWLVDRILRNQLTDLTGNTHRAEFCIDKLYSPDSSTGRLGILELRAFEMPPHARMSLLQQLLLRALIAKFWKEPYHHKLSHWGTALHDRFLLPHFVKEDLAEVTEDLQAAGFPFQAHWFDPFLEFRFPRYGNQQIGHIRMELRFAIEPWHVLGEEATGSGTARYVDSSAERLQLKVSGLTDERHAVTCNGRRVPLTPTGVSGEFVSGIRYQAWAPWSAMHPTLKPQTPLVFDVIDLWNGRSLGGCTYHVAHPGGRSYDTFPVNAFEAESRRVSRFWQDGHTQDSIEKPAAFETIGRYFAPAAAGTAPVSLPEEPIDPEFPCTFDLRMGLR